ncbi:MAG TPA: enoyl-CoA hydratase [Stellaceae bacterium]|nr:enoyl-CoA hydratase [Stellaceae bacterium]
MSEAPVLTAIEGEVAWITLNRPQQMNAMSPALTQGLGEAIAALEEDERVRVVVITGAGSAFSAGGDLKSFREAVLEGKHAGFVERLRRSQAIFRRIEQFPRPVIAAVNGVAVAGGLELILSCDIVIAAQSARIGDGHAKFGIIPGAGASARLPRKLPVTIAKQLFFTGDLVPAADWARWGLVNEVVPDAELKERVSTLAQRIARNSPLGLTWMKRLVNDGLEQPLETALRAEHAAFESYVKSEDFAEGLAAFEEKRKPRFKGR